MQSRIKSGNLNKIVKAKFAETATWNEEFMSLI